MIKIGIVGGIGVGKSYVAKKFGYPVFNADVEVSKIYRKSKKCFKKLEKALSKHIFSFPIRRKELSKAVMENKNNVIKIRGDWTKPNKKIEQYLNSYNRFGVPFNAIYNKNYPQGIILSELLTTSEIISAIDSKLVIFCLLRKLIFVFDNNRILNTQTF